MIGMIAALSQNNVIGKDNKLPFSYPEDLKHFAKTTRHTCIIMGRKTREGLPCSLPQRTNIIVTSQDIFINESYTDVKIVKSIPEAITFWKQKNIELAFYDLPIRDLWFIGGAGIYEEGMKYADTILLTRTPDTIVGDNLVYFPEINSSFKLKTAEPFAEPSKLILETYQKC